MEVVNKKAKILIIITILLFMVSVVGASFAYFISSVDINANLNLNVATADRMYQFIADSNDSINLDISFNDMSAFNVSKNVLKSSTANINVSLASSSEDVLTTCTYDIVWVWDSEDKYTSSDAELPYIVDEDLKTTFESECPESADKDLCLTQTAETQGIDLSAKEYYPYEFSTKVDEDREYDLSTLTKGIKDNSVIIKKGAVINSRSTTPITKTHQIGVNVYNIPVDQNNLFGKKIKAHITIENVSCNMTNDTTFVGTLADGVKAEDFAKIVVKDSDTANKTTDQCTNGIGGLIYHDGSIKSEDGTILDADDKGYRYSGCNPNNYICFGPGSEDYNSGKSTVCPTENKYRIIGIVPVETENNESQMLAKIIKAEYATESELGITQGNKPTTSQDYVDLKRIEGSLDNISGFSWSSSNADNWENSELYKSLNDNETGFLHYIIKDYNTEQNRITNWENKIASVMWNVGGWNNLSATAKAMYDGEMKNANNDENGAGTKVSAKIGLMYVHDYGYASTKNNWNLQLSSSYNDDPNRQNNWLFNGVNEWTISISVKKALGFSLPTVSYIDGNGQINPMFVVQSMAVRPVFYLNQDVTIKGDNNIDGSAQKPYKIA